MLTVVAGIVGLIKDSGYITDMAFDILSMVALFLVPRLAHLSLVPRPVLT